jgi:hypothetical protein
LLRKLPVNASRAMRSELFALPPVCRAGAGDSAAEKEEKLFEHRWPQAKRASSFLPADEASASV